MSEATSSPAHTLHGVYKDNFNLHSIRQAAIGVGSSVHAQLSMLPVAAPRLCYSRYCSSPITFIVLTIIAPHSRYTKINETPLYQQQMSEGGGGTAVAIVWVSVVLRMFRVYIQSKPFIAQSVLRQAHSLFQSQFSTGCDLVLPLPTSTLFRFLQVIQQLLTSSSSYSLLPFIQQSFQQAVPTQDLTNQVSLPYLYRM